MICRLIACWVVAGLLFLVAGCGVETSDPETGSVYEPRAKLEKPPTPVSLLLNWFPEAEHGGFFAADVHEFYDSKGLDVEIRPGGPGTQVVSQVATGRVMFGITNADRVLVGHAAGAKTVALMAAMQVSPRCVMVHENSGVDSLDKLNRVSTLAVNSTATWSLFLQKKVDLGGVQLVPYAGNVSQFLLNDDYAQQAYSISEPFVALQQMARPRVLMVSKLGFNPYTSVLITSPETIHERPDLVRRMVLASIQGWRKYLDDPLATNQAIFERNEDMGLPILAFGARELKRLCITDKVPRDRLGAMTETRWKTLADQLIEVEAIEDGSVDIKQAFTTEFLPAR
tara:strand:- start:128 stop:1150 length:1023 start_codon:yes stop_codon:yes gene_type:complete